MGSIPKRYLTWTPSSVLYCLGRAFKRQPPLFQSVERATIFNARFISFFFCLPFVYPHILHAAKFWVLIGQGGTKLRV